MEAVADPKVWAFRAGPADQRASWALRNGTTPGGFGLVPDLSEFTSRDQIREVVRSVRPDRKPGNWAGQLWALRTDMTVGDMIVMPCPERMFAFGRVREDYRYLAEKPDPDFRHVRSVE
ncbi:hypothetical protein ACSHWG_09575 [Leucobacter sp. Z1108]|uniref:hypothetical protein n=1 Tax=Leucobacter sp. Z1108 TaxID=3439066 RepID=UPI003F394E26